MLWQQLIFSTTAETAEQLNELLMETEALAITLQDAADEPIFEPPLGTTPLWGNTQLKALFDEHTDILQIIQQLQHAIGELPPYQITQVEEQNWERAWMDEFKPMQFGKCLWICPSWSEIPNPKATNLLLDPGLAFGTGTHPTTRLCLEWLDANALSGLEVIDYGCGSGVLALAAVKLGAKIAYAIDNDPQALLATRDNALRNQITERQLQTFLPEQLSSLSVDLLVANILAQPLIELAERLAKLVKPQGTIVLSGILAEQTEQITQTYKPWFTIQEVTQLEGWIRTVGIKNI